LRNVCTEAGLFAIRSDRDFVIEEDFMKAARKVAESKKLEGSLDYKKVKLAYSPILILIFCYLQLYELLS